MKTPPVVIELARFQGLQPPEGLPYNFTAVRIKYVDPRDLSILRWGPIVFLPDLVKLEVLEEVINGAYITTGLHDCDDDPDDCLQDVPL